jgi:uncharacterized BrkB/YihY/UPF0761 family membrane protein
MQKRGQTLEEFCPEGSLAGVLVSTVVKYPHTIDHLCLKFAAGLSYYFVLSLFPLLVSMASLLGYVPIPHLMDR